MLQECEKFPIGSFHRQVCEGKAETLDFCNKQRNRWGLQPLLTVMPEAAGGVKKSSRIRGLGDLVARGIKVATFGLVIPCGGCKGRQEFLNRLVPFGHQEKEAPVLKWSYGVTTVPQRRHDLLPRTLNSLILAGFDRPRLFVDGASTGFGDLGLETTYHQPALRTFGNWITALWELYIREPMADRYAIFQDDFVTCRNLRRYLETVEYPENGYLNLYTFPCNQQLAPGLGWYPSDQMGKGALALVFNKSAVTELLSSEHMAMRPQHAVRGHKSVDGGIVTALKATNRKEYVHNPSLVQHTGDVSSMGNGTHQHAISFRGEQWDAMEMLREVVHAG